MGTPLAFVWLLLEVGLVEFFFRVLLQSRLAAWLDSEAGGVVLMSLLFGLAHAPPGLYFRSGKNLGALGLHPTWLMAVGYSIVATSLTGFFLGMLWARTRNLLLVMVVHAATDLVPNLAPMLRNWL